MKKNFQSIIIKPEKHPFFFIVDFYSSCVSVAQGDLVVLFLNDNVIMSPYRRHYSKDVLFAINVIEFPCIIKPHQLPYTTSHTSFATQSRMLWVPVDPVTQ